MFTVNNKDTRTTTLISLILIIVNTDILNTHYSCVYVWTLELTLNRQFLGRTNDITDKSLKIKSFSLKASHLIFQ